MILQWLPNEKYLTTVFSGFSSYIPRYKFLTLVTVAIISFLLFTTLDKELHVSWQLITVDEVHRLNMQITSYNAVSHLDTVKQKSKYSDYSYSSHKYSKFLVNQLPVAIYMHGMELPNR